MIKNIALYLFSKLSICIVFLFIYKAAISNDNFEINYVHVDKVFYNIVRSQNKIFVGTSKGIYQIKSNNELLQHDKTIVGYINTKLQKSKVFKIKYIEPPVLLPNPFSKTATDFATNGNALYVISRGVLFIYLEKSFAFTRYNSVRSISENCVGTYNGVFVNGVRLKKTQYTDGQIKEFNDLIFVCFNGLTVIDDNKEKILYWNDNSISSKAKFGEVENIYFIKNDDYLVISSKGIYLYNYKLNSFNLIYSAFKKIIPVRNTSQNIQNDNEFNFVDNNKFLTINTENFATKVKQNQLKHKIIDILECSFDGSYFYGISEDNFLLNFKKSDNGIKLISAIELEYSYHTIIDSEDLVFLLGNNGLSVYDKNFKKIHYNLITDEFNKNAVFKNKGDVSFGSIHGVYNIKKINVDRIKNIKSINHSSYFHNSDDYSSKHHFYIFTLLLVIIFIFLIIRSYIKQNMSDKKLVAEIKKFVRKNLSTVTLTSLQDQFKLDYHALNNLQKDFKPAKFIRRERNLKAKELFQKKQDISIISDLTGYSESYLIRNKQKYLQH